MTDDVPASQRWRGRPIHSLLLQLFVFAIPVIASVAAATAVSAWVPRPDALWEFIGWWVVLTAIALAVLVVVDRVARKLLPLAALLKLSMVFPDRAPSRFRVARNAASVRKLQEQLAEARERGLTAEPVWAAETVLTLITALGHHDRRSRGHSERVHVYAELLAEELDLPEYDRDRLRWAALLHDVGKLVVPAELLNKPAAPDDDEWDALRSHPKAGAELCAPLLPWLGEWGLAIEEHHEWFDGTGYPMGLSGLDISRAARIVAVADCYEVMTTSRTYKRALNPAAAREELARCAGTQFDPAIVRAFLNISLGRLRLAMGPLALLSTVPSMGRLSSLFEPLARAGAVISGAALLVGGGTVFDSGATAQPAAPRLESATVSVVDAAVAPPGLNSVAVAEHRMQSATAVAGVWASSNLSPTSAATAADAAGFEQAVTWLNQNTVDGNTSGKHGDRESGKATKKRSKKASDDGGGKKASPAKGKAKPEPPSKAKAKAKAKRAEGTRADGADPTPPTSPPGLEPQKPRFHPPADPEPPRNKRAQGRQL